MRSKTFSVFFHNYYGNDQDWISFLSHEFQEPFNLFYNCVADSYYRLRAPALSSASFATGNFPDQFTVSIKQSPNKGKDIGGKLVLMDAYLRMNDPTDYILLLHDKHSPYHPNGEKWKKDLLRIATREYQQQVFQAFRENTETGIVASENAIRNELNNDQKRNAYIDSPTIDALRKKYGIDSPDLQYVAGTMFWVRASLMEDFFNVHSPLYIRGELENGNIADDANPTITHAWERMLCWLITSRGYQIRGI
jgi:lipopolysaccharide biosynthesis protein